jgi:hypothetical protein
LLPGGLFHLYAELFSCGFDSVEGFFALFVGDVLDLVEAGDGVADVRGVFQGLFAFVGEGEVGGVDVFAVVGRESVGFGWHEVPPEQTCCGLASGRLVGLDDGCARGFGCGGLPKPSPPVLLGVKFCFDEGCGGLCAVLDCRDFIVCLFLLWVGLFKL